MFFHVLENEVNSIYIYEVRYCRMVYYLFYNVFVPKNLIKQTLLLKMPVRQTLNGQPLVSNVIFILLPKRQRIFQIRLDKYVYKLTMNTIWIRRIRIYYSYVVDKKYKNVLYKKYLADHLIFTKIFHDLLIGSYIYNIK